jgi:hypothetical protein
VSGYPDQRSWKNVGTANTHKKKKSKEKRNEIQSPQKDLLLMTSWDPFSIPSTSKVHPMRRDKDRYEISTKRTLAIRKRRPRNVNLGICYLPSTSQTSQSDVFCASMGLQCAIWEGREFGSQRKQFNTFSQAMFLDCYSHSYRVRIGKIWKQDPKSTKIFIYSLIFLLDDCFTTKSTFIKYESIH